MKTQPSNVRRIASGRRALAFASALFAASAIGCSDKPSDGVASAEPGAAGSAATPASASAARAVDAPPPEPPTLRAVPVPELEKERAKEKDLADGASLFTVPDAVLIGTWNRVGRLRASGIEWKGSLGIPEVPYGRGMIQWAGGLYPDAIDITFSFENGRAAQPTYAALTGKGASVTFAAGGGAGWIHGVARIGESVLVSGYDMQDGHRVVGARGPAITRLAVPWKLRCGEKKPSFTSFGEVAEWRAPAVRPLSAYQGTGFAASPAGTLFSYGLLCDEKAAVEVWRSEGGQPRIIELGQWIKPEEGGLLIGLNDDVWITSNPILAWKGDHFEPLPAFPQRPTDVFVSTRGELHVADGSAIHRWDGQRFVEVARLEWPSDFGDIAVEDGTFWVTLGGRVHRLEKGEPAARGEACKTPFVFLYDVADKSEPKYSFPSTRKALSTFAPLEGVELVDFVAGRRRLGAFVPSWEVGVAVAAHIEKTMKDEHPRVVCFKPDKSRAIPIAGNK